MIQALSSFDISRFSVGSSPERFSCVQTAKEGIKHVVNPGPGTGVAYWIITDVPVPVEYHFLHATFIFHRVNYAWRGRVPLLVSDLSPRWASAQPETMSMSRFIGSEDISTKLSRTPRARHDDSTHTSKDPSIYLASFYSDGNLVVASQPAKFCGKLRAKGAAKKWTWLLIQKSEIRPSRLIRVSSPNTTRCSGC